MTIRFGREMPRLSLGLNGEGRRNQGKASAGGKSLRIPKGWITANL